MTTTPEQIALGNTRLTGSTVAAMLGRSHYQRPSECWEVKMGLREFAGNDYTESGNDMEEPIARMVAREFGFTDLETPPSIFHPDYPDMWVVHLDRRSPEERISIQIKNHEPHLRSVIYQGKPGDAPGGWGNYQIPEQIHLQVQWEMGALAGHYGAKEPKEPEWGERCILAAYFGGSKPLCYWIKRDTRLLKEMIRVGKFIWRDHLDPNGPQTCPSDDHWVGPHKKAKPKPRKLTLEEQAAAPINF